MLIPLVIIKGKSLVGYSWHSNSLNWNQLNDNWEDRICEKYIWNKNKNVYVDYTHKYEVDNYLIIHQ